MPPFHHGFAFSPWFRRTLAIIRDPGAQDRSSGFASPPSTRNATDVASSGGVAVARGNSITLIRIVVEYFYDAWPLGFDEKQK
jgi:hypothetical protein